jgi:hypothetical protein
MTGPDKRNGNKMPSTGGEWLSLKPGLSVQRLDRVNVQLNAEVPVYQRLEGTQPSTSYIFSASVFVNLKKQDTGFRPGGSFE